MANQASGIAARLAMQVEPSFGVAPATPKMTVLNGAAYGESLVATVDEIVSEAINPNRGVLSSRNGVMKVSGSVPFELPVQNGELIYYGFMGSYVQTDVTVNGATKHQKVFSRAKDVPSLLIEKGFTDINQYFLYRGCKINNIQLTVDPTQKVSGTFEIMGQGIAQSVTAFDSAPATFSHTIFTGVTDATILKGAQGVSVSKLTLSITNGLYASNVIGSQVAKNVGVGKSEVTGEITVLFTDAVLYNQWINELSSDLRVTFAIGNDSTEFYFPDIKLTGDGSAKIENQEGISLTFKWRGLVDQVQGSPTFGKDVIITVTNDYDLTALLS